MTIRAHRSRLIWSPLIGWALLSCNVSSVHAQATTTEPTATTTPSDADTGNRPTMPSSIPAGGAAAPIVLPTNPTQPYGAPKPGDPNYSIYQQQINQTSQPVAPSASTTIVNAPFGSRAVLRRHHGPGIGRGHRRRRFAARPAATGITLGSFTLTRSRDQCRLRQQRLRPERVARYDRSPYTTSRRRSTSVGLVQPHPARAGERHGRLVCRRADAEFPELRPAGRRQGRHPPRLLCHLGGSASSAPPKRSARPTWPSPRRRRSSKRCRSRSACTSEFNRVFYQMSAKATRYWYYDNSTITSYGPAGDRAATASSTASRCGSATTSARTCDLLSRRRQPDPLHRADQLGRTGAQFGRLELSASARHGRLNAVSVLEGEIGYQTPDLSNRLAAALSALSFGLKGTWTGYAPLTLRPTITRAINRNRAQQLQELRVDHIRARLHLRDPRCLDAGRRPVVLSIADYASGRRLGRRSANGLLLSRPDRPALQHQARDPDRPFLRILSRLVDRPDAGPSYDRQIYSIRLIAKR